MGQKVNPIGLRLGIVKTWESRWYADKNYADYILADYNIRKYVKEKLYHAGVSRIEIERSSKLIRLRIHTVRPGIVIGKKGAEISQLKKEVEKLVSNEVIIDIQEVRKPETDAQLVAEGIAQQLERRVMFRRAMKRAVTNTMRLGAQRCNLKAGTRAHDIYANDSIYERHRHRYEFNNTYMEQLSQAGLEFSGLSDDGLVEVVELPGHPWFLACQFHPEFTSNPRDGHPLFTSFVSAARSCQGLKLPRASGE